METSRLSTKGPIVLSAPFPQTNLEEVAGC